MENNLESLEYQGEPLVLEATAIPEISVSVYVKEEPLALRFIRSGWANPTMYHVLFEQGDFETTDYKGLMSGEQIKELYGIEIVETLDINKMVKENPNNMDLGNTIRKIARELTQNTKI